jgi:SHS2 domain-containing protein
MEVRGNVLPELFAAGVTALFSLLTDRRRIRPAETRTLEISGGDSEDRLLRLLREALLLFTAERFLVRSARGTMKRSGVTVEVSGEPFDASRHAVFREVKAVTAHGMAVTRVPGGFAARFIADV